MHASGCRGSGGQKQGERGNSNSKALRGQSHVGWSSLLIVCGVLFALAVGSAQAMPVQLNDPLVTDGNVDDQLVSPDGSRVIYLADQDVDEVLELYSVPVGGGTVTKLNTPLGAGQEVGSFIISPDSTRVVYRADQTTMGDFELYSVPIGGGAITKLNDPLPTDGDVSSGFLISPDSTRVVYRAEQDTNDDSELYSVPIGGGTVTKLNAPLVADGDVISGFLISPDNTRVVYRADQDTFSDIELYSVPIGGSTVTQLNAPLVADGDVFSGFRISPDSARVVYRADQDTTNDNELYSVPIGGGTVTQLNAPLVADGDVSSGFLISPDSARVVYQADQDTNNDFELYSVPLGGGTVTQLNAPLVADGDVISGFRISPDSARVVYQADQDTFGDFELYSVPLGGGTVTQLNGPLVADGDVFFFLISPDSARVVYRADQDTNNDDELYSVPIGGGAVTQLNAPLVADGDVSSGFLISPDSTRVVYRADQDTNDEVELYSVPIGGGAVTQLNAPLVADGDVISGFRISPDSTRVVYRADQDTNGVTELFSIIIHAELKALFESPIADAIVAGIALIRGWAFDIVPGATIASVKFFIDGVEDTEVECCSERADVRDAFPEYAAINTLNSGWGLTKNWGNEDGGVHTVRVEIMSSTGEAFSETRTVTVVKPGDFGFLDQFILGGATASLVSQQFQLSGVQIRDKDSQATATVNGTYAWQGPSQQFELLSSIVVAQAQPQRMFALQKWWQKLWSVFEPSSVVAQGMGLRTAWEGPVAGPVGGVDLVRGWGYEQAPAESLGTIRFFIDNSQNALVVCCSPRPDVAAAFPADTNALLSGWGLTLNWGNLTEGQHTAQIQFESTTGESVLSDSRTITVIRPGGFGFLSGLTLAGAMVSLDGEEIVITGATVTESGTGNIATVTLRLAWDIGAQGLRLVSAVTT